MSVHRDEDMAPSGHRAQLHTPPSCPIQMVTGRCRVARRGAHCESMTAGTPTGRVLGSERSGPTHLRRERRSLMALTLWSNEMTGERLDRLQLDGWRMGAGGRTR